VINKGSDLERRIEEFFKLNGYRTSRNEVLTGRSGGRHEIDVLATKTDGITDFRVLVECKAWSSPIEKDVLAKTAYVMGDLGIHKGIVVALRGWTTGAETSANEIELWGNDELFRKLGSVAVAELESGSNVRAGRAFPIGVGLDVAVRQLEKQGGGLFGIGREEHRWTKLVWLPFFVFHLSHAQNERRLFKSDVTKRIRAWNLFEALSGEFFADLTGEPVLQDLRLGTTIPPRVGYRKIATEIRTVQQKRREVVTETAQKRYDARLIDLGIPPTADTTSVDKIEDVHFPFYITLFERGGKERLVALDANGGRFRPGFDEVLTDNLSYLLEVLKAADARTTPRPLKSI
jgi:restriction system protein